MGLQQLQQRGDVEMPQADRVGEAPRLANAAAPRDLEEEPASTAEHLGQLRPLTPPAVEPPLPAILLIT